MGITKQGFSDLAIITASNKASIRNTILVQDELL